MVSRMPAETRIFAPNESPKEPNLPQDTRTIAIVGAGFSGTVLAVNLLQSDSTQPLRVVLIERNALVGRGVAYAPTAYPYLLNVPASRMSASPQTPSEFVDYARTHGIAMGPDDFAPRRLYGEYLWDLLQRAGNAAESARLEIVHGIVRRLKPSIGTPFELELEGLPNIRADQVVLCVGSPPPAPVCAMELKELAHAYVANPYADAIDFTRAPNILLLGTGLTMADVAVAADTQNPGIVVHALSRHGLLPKIQSTGKPIQTGFPDVDGLPNRSLKTLLPVSRQMALDVRRQGGDWRDVVVSLRSIASRVWKEWSDLDRGRFLRHLRTHWDIHRHRLPPQTSSHLERMQAENRLHVHAGRVRRFLRDGNQIRAEWLPRRANDMRAGSFDLVINCTGATCSLDRWDDPLIKSLYSEGLISADTFALGLRTGDHGIAIGAAGKPTRGLYYLGPMLRADHWEATATTELRHHAQGMARNLLQSA
jgi:uncharacterized NAD(P)/FAD-binding protein YdhS